MSTIHTETGKIQSDEQAPEAKPVSTTERQVREAAFHDEWADAIDVDEIAVEYGFESATASENQHILNLFGDVNGKKILDLGCGMGDASVYLATLGAEVHSIDISPGMIRVAERLADRYGVGDRVHAQVMGAEVLNFPDDTFDFVYGNGVLHHVDYMQSTGEVFRVLKPGGKAAFIEPLAYNPVIWVYRRLAAQVRSEDEHPLYARDLDLIRNAYAWSTSGYNHFHMLTLLIMVWFFVGERLHPSETRYWKYFVEQGDKYSRSFGRLQALDRALHRILPPTRWYSWNVVLSMTK